MKHAEGIKHEFGRLKLEVGRRINKTRRAKDVNKLQQYAERVYATLPKRGRLPQRARHHFVDRLADIYEPLTGEEAGLSKVDQPCGPFYDFVVAALKPLALVLPGENPANGIAHVISDVARERKSRQA